MHQKKADATLHAYSFQGIAFACPAKNIRGSTQGSEVAIWLSGPSLLAQIIQQLISVLILAQMATNPAGAAETTVAGDAAAALPPQLNEMLGDAAPKVASFAELVRGVSWTQQLMEDVSHQLRNFGAFRVALDDIPGFAEINVLLIHCTRKQTKQELRELHAEVSCCRRVLDRPQHSSIAEHPLVTDFKIFPDTPQGAKAAIEFLRASVQYLSRRGFWETCLQLERPKKRIRLQSCDVCGECLLKRALS